MSTYQRKMEYRRDTTNRHGQGLLPWGPGRSISTLQAAELMGVSDDMIREMCETGELEAYRLRDTPKSPWRIVRTSLDRHIGRVLEEYGPEHPSPARSGLPPLQLRPPRPRLK